jgi:hypothetical protein
MRAFKSIVLLPILCLNVLVAYVPVVSPASDSGNLVIRGLVSNQLNLTYSELENLRMVWEVVPLQCVFAPYPLPFNWTGIPLFYLLSLAGVQNGAKEVVFRGNDGFSSSISLDKAMHPTTILALKVNGTTLPPEDEYPTGLPGGYPYKVVVPCKFGYKWVGKIVEIEVVDYDYKGTYESQGFSDEADNPSCQGLPETTPAYTIFNATWRETYPITVFANNTIQDARFNENSKQIQLEISGNDTASFVYAIIPKQLLTSNFTILVDNEPTAYYIIQNEANSYVLFQVSEGDHSINIEGRLLADISGPSGIPDGNVDMRDIGTLCAKFGKTPSQPGWDADMDINNDSMVNMRDIGIACSNFGKHV